MQANGHITKSHSLYQQQQKQQQQPPENDKFISLRCLARIVPLPKIVKHVILAATWRTSSVQDSFYLLATWWIICWQFYFVSVYIFPLILIALLHYMSGFREDKDEEKRLQQALETLRGIESMEQLWKPKDRRQSLIIFIYLYISWVIIHQRFTTQQTALVVGTLALLWSSPFMKIVRQVLPTAFLHSLFMGIFIGPLESSSTTTTATTSRSSPLSKEERLARRRSMTQRVEDFQRDKMQHHATTSVFEFVIYENQRSWPLTGWRAATIPFLDRAPWTDPAKKPLAPKSEFQLPETIQTKLGAWQWTWTDAEWRLTPKTETDALGWTYGTLLWSLFDGHSKGWMSTRYRRWARTATLTNASATTASHSTIMRNNTIVTSPTVLRPPHIDTASPQLSSSITSPASPNPSLMSRGRKLTSSVRFSTTTVNEQDNESIHSNTTANTNSSTTTFKKKLWSSGSSNSSKSGPPAAEHKRDSVWRSIARVNSTKQ
ncbi:integral peroxisomal membrane peroxin-domain-containing protein [Phascolomyces articulosus]|uniref:Integral peroxisomal membrane peroxin-domain-containing protein n=1 Tax=Phascolomyces articulosus TaxID=60185 RepID=A0AAD5PG70_9FUNG|nr:integral peroxisomal membrane peroxin-domain-containing protein [Phascolomyces articulosus]